MKIRELVAESALFELRRAVTTKLSEAINKHLLSASAALSNRKDTDKDLKGVDVDQLASIITTMKVLSNAEYRDSMTKDDIGINPRNAKELFSFLDQIPDNKSQELSGVPKEVVSAVTHLAPSIKSKEVERLKDLGSDDVDTRRAAEAYLKAFATKVDLSYNKVRAAAEATQAKAA
jgi:hypothetical protein